MKILMTGGKCLSDMIKLFKAIRHGNIEEVKQILEKKPEAVNSVSGLTPKKDHGQSPLQVALKTGHIEIAEYLIVHGADINFIEAEDDDPGLRMAPIFDAIGAAISSLCYKRFDESNKALILLEKMIKMGADVNSFTSNGLGTVNWAVFCAMQILEYPDLYIESQDEARKKLAAVLDLLIENGVDLASWAVRGFYGEPNPGPTSRMILLDPEDSRNGLNLSKIMPLREFIQEYFDRKNIRFN